MSYKAGESVLDHSYCEADLVRSAKANVRFFIEILIGAVIAIGLIGLLGSTIIGSLSCLGGCFGCEACLETAACADGCLEDMGCDECSDSSYGEMGCWEEMTAENIAAANECASCEGVDCFGRQGCFASKGCGDTESCAGEKYYTVTVVAGESRKTMQIHEDQTSMTIYYPSGVDSSYYQFKGYFDKNGKQYVDASGYIVKTLKNNLELYGRYEEYGLGNTYEFVLDLSTFGEHSKTITLTVGGQISTELIPVAPEKEGYTFVGWYMNGTLVYSGNITDGEIFHLYTFGLSAYSGYGPYTLTPKYEPKSYTVTLVYNDNYYRYEAAYGNTYQQVYNRFYWDYVNLSSDENFFGWGTSDIAMPEDAIKGDTVVQESVTLYAIYRSPVKAYFYYNRGSYDDYYIEVKLYDGQRNVNFNSLEELAQITNEDTRPGYKFTGWYTSSSLSDDAQAVSGIDSVSQYNTYRYYAGWTTTDYTIEYYAMHYDSDTLNKIDTQTYSYSNEMVQLKAAEEATPNYGYDFIGWSYSEDGSTGTLTYLPSGTYGNKKLYAIYQPKTFAYTWDCYPGTVNGTDMNTELMVYGQANQLPMPTREGYNFLGWRLEGTDIIVGDTSAYVSKFTFKTLGMEVTPASEAKLTNEGFYLVAEWEVQTFKVTFKVDDRTISEQTIDWGKYVVEPEAPTKTGYDFKYWKDENGNRFYPTAQIKKDWTLTAHFDIKKYTVIFNYDGQDCQAIGVPHGTTIKEAESYVSGSWPNYVGTVPRKQIGWFESSAVGAVEITADTPITSNDMKVYAQFEYAKTFTFNGATESTKYYFVGDKHVFPEAYQKGYTFLGWGTSESGSVTVSKGEEVRIKESTITTYYPKFKAIEYTITYYVGNVEYASDTYTIEDDKQLIAVDSSKAPNKVGYTFTGWKIDTNGDYIGEGAIVSKLTNNTENKAFIAQFDNNNYTIILENEGLGIEIPVTYDKTFNFGMPLEEREGCHFVGWAWRDYDEDAANKQLITDEKGASKGVYDYDGDRRAYPIFERNQYTFYWYVDGEVKAETYQKHFDERVSPPADPVKDGYTFEGWYTNSSLTEAYDFTHEVTGREYIHAKFTINSYTIKFMVGNEQKHVTTLNYNASLANAINEAQAYANAYAELHDAKFKCWKEANKGTVYTTSSTVPAGDITLVAVFDMPIYVHFDHGNGTTVDSEALYTGAQITAGRPIRNGYEFLGWYQDGVQLTNFPLTAKGSEEARTDLYYVAKWKAIEYEINYYIYDSYGYPQYIKTEKYSMDQTEETGGYKLWNGGENKGYYLDGWYIENNGYALSSIDNTDKAEGSKTYGTLNLYAAWLQQKYTITFKGVDGTIYKTLEVTNGQMLDTQSWIVNIANGTKPAGTTRLVGFALEGTNNVYINANGQWMGSYGTFTKEESIVLVAYWR